MEGRASHISSTTEPPDGVMAGHETVYLADLVASRLAARGIPGTVRIRPHRPLAARLESGERATFLVEYEGVGAARVRVDEYEIACGTVGASVVTALADRIECERHLAKSPDAVGHGALVTGAVLMSRAASDRRENRQAASTRS